ncbi:MAG: DUF3465 domain-containing protein [Thermovirgaceae bacterium]|nr:DUF3465 domain-containing protein [Thermovirgaceae bacterium]
MKKIVLIAAVLAAACFAVIYTGVIIPDKARVSTPTAAIDDPIARLFSDRRSGVQVQGSGIVIKILPDDNDGSRHQRFIIRLATGQTLLVAHNIDQAVRIETLETGDSLGFSGEYEWNPEGGVIHWTHRDSAGRHLPGWIIHKGKKYW